MQYYTTALIFLALISSLVSVGLRSQSFVMSEAQLIFNRCRAQQKALDEGKREKWSSIGVVVEKRTPAAKSGKTKRRSLPIQRLDIMPLFAKEIPAFEELVFSWCGMEKALFDAFVISAKKRYAFDKESFNEQALFALEFDDPSQRADYYACLKGRDPLFDKIKLGSVDSKIPVHQMSDQLARVLFSKESAERVIAHRKAVVADQRVPLWTSGDLLQLKVKNPQWREFLKAGVDSSKDQSPFQRVRVERASIDRPTSPLS